MEVDRGRPTSTNLCLPVVLDARRRTCTGVDRGRPTVGRGRPRYTEVGLRGGTQNPENEISIVAARLVLVVGDPHASRNNYLAFSKTDAQMLLDLLQISFHGGLGHIYKASYAGQAVVLKVTRTFTGGGEDQRRILLHFHHETLLWQSLRHPYILPFIGIDRETFAPSVCMLSEIAQGLQYLHSQRVVHGDLRGTNILITNEFSACLADFGLSSFSDVPASHNIQRGGAFGGWRRSSSTPNDSRKNSCGLLLQISMHSDVSAWRGATTRTTLEQTIHVGCSLETGVKEWSGVSNVKQQCQHCNQRELMSVKWGDGGREIMEMRSAHHYRGTPKFDCKSRFDLRLKLRDCGNDPTSMEFGNLHGRQTIQLLTSALQTQLQVVLQLKETQRRTRPASTSLLIRASRKL
ncbi:kinase-like domain-containing protein [Mycena galopus ATCC 62051]|nr:kinase-like domain-containing protein [Mycena galopus ATCC 62051]